MKTKDRTRAKAYSQYSYGKDCHPEPGGKIILEKGLLFENVHKFREVLKDYTIQEGFILVRDKNEKSRVTCHCAAIGCHLCMPSPRW